MIAIHDINSTFAERWIQYCEEQDVEYLRVNIYDSNIINYLKSNNVQVLFAQPAIDDYKAGLIARAILFSIEKMGIITFPNYKAFWHYDDKISQKYLFEALDIIHARMYVFYDKHESMEWLSTVGFPLVFKLRGGASSSNVLLIKNKENAFKLVNRMFTSGIKPIRSVVNDFRTKIGTHSIKRDWIATFKRLPKTLNNIVELNKKMPRQIGYFFVQEFLPDNKFDTRVVIVGNKAFTFRRFTRPNDFRASGSKNVDLNQNNIDRRAIKLAFDTAKKIGSFSMAFDIMFNAENEPVIIEMSYTCPIETINKLEGYWDPSLVFHNANIRLEDAIIEHVLGVVNQTDKHFLV